ncbi:protein RnfH, partial [gut metagenome]
EENVTDASTVREALKQLSIAVLPGTGFSVFARRVTEETVLKEGDRLEIASPLLCDVKKVRSERALKQGDIRVVTCGRHGGRRQVVATKD